MSNSRKKNTIYNISVGWGSQLITLILNFISRTVFINILGVEFLGISSLFSNVLTILSLADLGIGSAIVYGLYEPLAKKNYDKVSMLLKYYKVLYWKIAGFVFLGGISVMPFLDKIINTEYEIEDLSMYYFIFLINTVVSYLCVYKTSILNADQKMYKLKIISTIFSLSKTIIQIISLLVFQNYMIYLTVQIIFSVANNIFSTFYVTKKYSMLIKYNNIEKISNTEKKEIWSNVKAMLSYKIGGVVMNNTDQILISTIVNTAMVGMYTNYYMIVSSISVFTSSIFISIQSSIGNLAVEKNPDKQYCVFKCLDLIAFWVYGFCSICFCILFQDFICVWLGENFLLSNITVYIISFSFYLTGALYPIFCYRETVGLFKDTKNILLYSSIINLILSIVLGNAYGLSGILIATVFARLLTNIWFEPYKLFKIYFLKKVSLYYINQVVKILMLILIFIVINFICSLITFDNIYFVIMIKLVLCIVIYNLIVILSFKKTDEFNYLKILIMERINKVSGKQKINLKLNKTKPKEN